MSMDIYLTVFTGKEYRELEWVGNYTHNCQGMWALALKESGYDARMCELDGMLAEYVAVMLEKAVAHMDDPANQPRYEEMNPSNGWGDFISAREFLRKVLVACQENPACFLRVSC